MDAAAARLAVLAALALAALPRPAAAERIVTRKGEVVEGTPRFEKDVVVVEKADGTEVRLPKAEVERIELSAPPPDGPDGVPVPDDSVEPAEGDATPDEAEEEEAYDDEDDGRPTYRPRRPPPPPFGPPLRPPPYRPRRTRDVPAARAYDQSGAAITFGYHRGVSLGGEWQYRPGARRAFGFGLGAQLGVESNPEVSFLTYGATGRFYLGREHRAVAEVGVGLNLIDPYLGTDCGSAICPEKSIGPEASLGYQYVSRHGLLFEVLGGLAFSTNQALIDAHGGLAPTFQLSMGYLFH